MPGTVPLARVYDALDAVAYRAFRAAMRRSRGGTVRVTDLIAGLAEVAPAAVAEGLRLDAEAVQALARPPASDPDLVPMANEPALREALTAAFERAGGVNVTPAHVLAELADRRPAPFFSFTRTTTARPVEERPRVEPLNLLRHWLDAQSLPPFDRDAAVARIDVSDARIMHEGP